MEDTATLASFDAVFPRDEKSNKYLSRNNGRLLGV